MYKKSVNESSFHYLPTCNTAVSLSESHTTVCCYDSWGRLCTLWDTHKGWRKLFHNLHKVFSMIYELTVRKQFIIQHVTKHRKSWWQMPDIKLTLRFLE